MQNFTSKLLTITTLLSLTTLGLACDPSKGINGYFDSEYVETNETNAIFTLSNSINGLDITSDFRKDGEENTGGKGRYYLGDDKEANLEFVQADIRFVIEEQDGEVLYKGRTFLKSDHENYKKLNFSEEMNIELIRPTEKKSALGTKIKFAELYELSFKDGTSDYNINNDDIIINISGESDLKNSYSFSGTCIDKDSNESTEFSGDSLKLDKGSLKLKKDSCTETITISKETVGTLDSEFKGGEITAYQEMTIKMNLSK